MNGAGAHALACRVADARGPADEEKAVLALDAMLFAEISKPEVCYILHAGSVTRLPCCCYELYL